MSPKMQTRLALLVLLAFAIAACSSQAAPTTYPVPPTQAPEQPGAYPLAPTFPAILPTSPYPDPNAPVSPGQPGDGSSYLPQPGDENFTRGSVFPDSASVAVMESFPPQYMLSVEGSLPTPCHQLRAQVEPPDTQNRIQVTLYSLVDPNAICIQVLKAFAQGISLGSLDKGSYTVVLNGKEVDAFTVE